MAWRASGINNAELIGNLKEDGTIESERVGKVHHHSTYNIRRCTTERFQAMRKVDRGNYVLEDIGFQAYSDSPQ
jgi:hypothetical protein